MKLCIFLAIFLLSIKCLWCSRINPATNKQVNEKNVILHKIIANYLEKYFIHEQIFVSLIHLPCEKEQNPFQCDVLHELLNDLAAAGFTHIVLNRLHNTALGNRNSFNLVLVEDSAALQKILNAETVQPIHLNEKFFVVLTESTETHSTNLKEVLQVLWKNSLIDSHVLSEDATNSWAIHTFLPYQNDCVTPSHLRIESFTKSNFSKPMNLPIRQVYPEKLENLNGCPLYVSVYTFWPNIVVHKTIDGRYYYKGFDISVTEEILKHLNSTIVYNMPLMQTEHGMVVKNRTMAEAFEVVTKGEANLTVGSFSKSVEQMQILSPGDPYLYTSFGFIYKKQQRQLGPMASILTPFNASVWLTILAILYISILTLLLTKNLTRKWRHFVIGGRMNRTPILNAWTTVLGHSIHNPQIANGRSFGYFSRTLTILWITLWFLVRCYYEGALYNYMQGYQPPPPYDTVQKVLASNCKVIYSTNGRKMVEFYVNPDRMIESSVTKFTLLDMLRMYHDSEIDGVVYTSDQFVRLFNVMYFPHRQLSFTKDQLFNSFAVHYFAKKSIFRDLFNRRIQIFHESGLRNVWYMEAFYAHRSRKIPKESLQSVLYFENIVGVIQICATMYLITFIVFVLEVMSLTYPGIKYAIDFLNY